MSRVTILRDQRKGVREYNGLYHCECNVRENMRIKFSARCVVVLTSLEPAYRSVGAEIFHVGTKP
jgi:hypothetical protein